MNDLNNSKTPTRKSVDSSDLSDDLLKYLELLNIDAKRKLKDADSDTEAEFWRGFLNAIIMVKKDCKSILSSNEQACKHNATDSRKNKMANQHYLNYKTYMDARIKKFKKIIQK